MNDTKTRAIDDEDNLIWEAAYDLAEARGILDREVIPADDAVGHKTMVPLGEYLVVVFVASDDIDDEQPGRIGWTVWDMAHDLDVAGGVFGTSDPAAVVADIQKVIGDLGLAHYDERWNENHPEEED